LPPQAAPGAFCNGSVKNQQGLATEVWQIGRSERKELLNFPQSRDESSSEKNGTFRAFGDSPQANLRREAPLGRP
jgi:hypothetical protein